MDKEIEIWKDIPNYEGLYQVSNWGQVKSLSYNKTGKEKIMKPSKDKNGYLHVNLYKDGKRKSFLVHRLVAMTFIPNLENLPIINHKDEDKQNNHVDNLEFCTHEYNLNYGTRNNRMSQAKKIPILQYTKQGVFIREWDSATDVEKELNISQGDISKCCNNNRKSAGKFIWRYKE